MLCAVWFSSDGRLWHPAGLPSLTEDEARAAANALYLAVRRFQWAWGPINCDGLVRVRGLTPERKKK